MHKFTLNYSQKECEIKEYVSQAAAVAFRSAMFEGLDAKGSQLQPTIEDFVEEFGAKRVAQLESIQDPTEYADAKAQMNQAYVMANLSIDQLMTVGVKNQYKAELAKMKSMVVSIDSKKPTEEQIGDLHPDDYAQILEEIKKVDKSPLVNGSSEKSASS